MERDDAMAAVIDSMGEAARGFKAKKYAPKPAPAAPAPEAPAEEAGPTMEELAALLGE